MTPPIENLLIPRNPSVTEEEFHTLLKTAQFRLEHIISHGEPSPQGFWYDQPDAEWVMLLQGTATLQFENDTTPLAAGDALFIPAHHKHRVEKCSLDAIWLALHFNDALIVET